MRTFLTRVTGPVLVTLGLTAATSAAAACGGNFATFVDDLRAEAIDRGYDPATVRSFFEGVRQDPATLQADRSQGVFQMPFVDFAQRLISSNRMQRGQSMSSQYDAVFDRIEREYGVPRGVLLAFWAFETDYGAVQGDFNTVNSLVTLAHDCRRPELFRPQVFGALELYAEGGLDPRRTTGAWAGEIGQVQMLPREIVERGVDGDGDGRVTLKTSPEDALVTGANVLRSLGWQPDQPWLVEVSVPGSFDWSLTGLDTKLAVSDWQARGVSARQGALPGQGLEASLILPQGRGGPAFLAYPNFEILFEWNESFVYVATVAYFATRLEGAPVFDAAGAPAGLGEAEMMELQRRLAARGYDVGGVDGILGAGTRSAVQDMQERLGLPADAWPTRELLNAL